MRGRGAPGGGALQSPCPPAYAALRPPPLLTRKDLPATAGPIRDVRRRHIAVGLAAHQQLRAFFLRPGHLFLEPVQLAGVDDRSDGGIRLVGIADRQRLDPFDVRVLPDSRTSQSMISSTEL